MLPMQLNLTQYSNGKSSNFTSGAADGAAGGVDSGYVGLLGSNENRTGWAGIGEYGHHPYKGGG